MTLARTWPKSSPRRQRALIASITLIVLSFLFFANNAIQTFPAVTISLENAHDPLVLEDATPPAAADSRNASRILLVSAMFPLPKSKHSHEEYEYWLTQFLQRITTDVYFFTTPDFAPVVRRSRPDGLTITIDTSYASPFDVSPLKGLEDDYAKMHNQDREKKIHSPALYAVWNAKPFLLNAAVKILAGKGRVYDYAFWNDAGSFRREHRYQNWPDVRRVEQIWHKGSEITGTNANDLLFFPLTGLPATRMSRWKEDMGPIDNEVSEGSFFGGSPQAISWWSRTYYAYHNHYLSLGKFVGKDQTLINALFLLFPSRIITVWYRDPLSAAHAGVIPFFDEGFLGACSSEWWYYQFWLADRSAREQMRDIWVSWSKWAGWEWYKERQRCRLTGVESMQDLLERQFGKTWVSPSKAVVVANAD
ncbi:hypothetical protein JR316_0009141 [Psilocybe cubensis]|uniref:Uncharacterized protein n=2 Tax=Psilocybe cubensis TaxID=181762 RepID=A0A8H7XZ30_PSICU|nr:hypothetical protein JR316_0009141 [Psilocybe cubensis]KAH9478683.1 hypothetical protein JR316_0009141 [Psilocybe cubensis]